MIEEAAVVTLVNQGQVWIKSLSSGACGGCSQQSSCGTATVSKWLPKREFALDCDQPLQVGDEVSVAIDDSHLVLSSLLLYLLPLLAMFGCIGLAEIFLPLDFLDDWLPEIALAALLLAFWAIHHLQKWLLFCWYCRPQIVGKLTSRS